MTGEKQEAVDVRSMFDRIAGRYRLMNRIITFGQDSALRKLVVRESGLAPGGLLLDAATGTGDIALEALRQVEGIDAVGADFSLEMMRVGRERDGGERIRWCAADALSLPFPDASFDAVTSGYLIRNVPGWSVSTPPRRRRTSSALSSSSTSGTSSLSWGGSWRETARPTPT